MNTVWINDVAYSYEKKFCFLPHICDISNKFLWMKFAYRITISDEFARGLTYIHRECFPDDLKWLGRTVWRDSKEHMIWLLKLKNDRRR